MAGSSPLILKSILFRIRCRCHSFKKMISTSYPPIVWDPATSPTYGKHSASFYPRFDYIIHKSVCPLNCEHLYSRKLHIYLNGSSALPMAHTWRQSRGMELSLGMKYQVGYQVEHCRCWYLFLRSFNFVFVSCEWVKLQREQGETALPFDWQLTNPSLKPGCHDHLTSSSHWMNG